MTGEKKEIVCPGTPHRGHFHDDEPCPLVEARGLTEPNPFEGLLIDRFYTAAQHEQVCQMSFNGLQRHVFEQGSPFGLAVYDTTSHRPPFKKLGYVCGECMHRIADGVSVQ